jgi:hypothetical protein
LEERFSLTLIDFNENLEVGNENTKIKIDLVKKIQETTKKDYEIARLTYVCEKIIEQAYKMLAHRPLARIYALYLKEKWYKFNIE